MQVALISTYELGRQPFGVASPMAWLKPIDNIDVSCLDLSRQKLDESIVKAADLIALYMPMHTATRIAYHVLAKIKEIKQDVHICAYGLYAPMNEEFLRKIGVNTILGGEFEQGLLDLIRRIEKNPIEEDTEKHQCEPIISLEQQSFIVPDRSKLPPLEKYARVNMPNGSSRIVGYTEATRGCKHKCRHCPVVPVYNGQFRIVQAEVVIEDIRNQVLAGAEHITFGDPDFFNGPGHTTNILKALHEEFPSLTYDVTIKVEHLLKHSKFLNLLADTGCLFVTTAVESLDDNVLDILEKGHTRKDFLRAVQLCKNVGLTLVPTFVVFTPWLTLGDYEDLLSTLARLDLIENVPSVQLAIRLLIPFSSRLLELPDFISMIGPFDEEALSYKWVNPDPRVDKLQHDLEVMIQDMLAEGASRKKIFEKAWEILQLAMGKQLDKIETSRFFKKEDVSNKIPYLSEPWYCCAEPTKNQLAPF